MLLDGGNKNLRLLELTAPGKQFQLVSESGAEDDLLDIVIIHAIHQGLSLGEQVKFLSCLLGKVDEILPMGLTDVGEHADGGTDDFLQGSHLIGFGDASLEDTQLMRTVHLPH